MAKIASLYLIPSRVILAALGVSATEPLKTAVSLVGLVLALFWGCSTLRLDRPVSPTNLRRTLAIMPGLFAVLWAVSLFVHGCCWWMECRSFGQCVGPCGIAS